MPLSHKLKEKTRRMVDSRHMLKGITIASFLESTIVPVPLEAVLIPLMQAKRDKLWAIALMATIGCICGALFGYALGYFLFDLVGPWIIETLSSPQQFESVQRHMDRQGFWFVITLGIVPIPFQIAMLAAGATHYSLVLFLLATLIARSIRYFGLAWVVYVAGDRAEQLIRRYRGKAVAVITLVILLVWWLSGFF